MIVWIRFGELWMYLMLTCFVSALFHHFYSNLHRKEWNDQVEN